MKDETEINKIEYTLFKKYCKNIKSYILKEKQLFDFSESDALKTLEFAKTFSKKLIDMIQYHDIFFRFIEFHINDMIDYQETKLVFVDNEFQTIYKIIDFLNTIKTQMLRDKNKTILHETYFNHILNFLQLEIKTLYIPKEEKLEASKSDTTSSSYLRRELISNYKAIFKDCLTLGTQILNIKRESHIYSERLADLYKMIIDFRVDPEKKMLKYTLDEREYILNLYRRDNKIRPEKDTIIAENLCIVAPEKFKTEEVALLFVTNYRKDKKISTKDILKSLEYI